MSSFDWLRRFARTVHQVAAERSLLSASADAQRVRPMKVTTIDDYIHALPGDVRPIAERVRALDRPVPYDVITLLASFKRAGALAAKKR